MSEHRQTPRRRVFLGGVICHANVASQTGCLLRDLSEGGARLRLSAAVPLPHRFDLAVPCRETMHRVEVIWRRGDETGLRFLDAAEPDWIAALRTERDASRAEAAALRARLAAVEAGPRGPGGRLH